MSDRRFRILHTCFSRSWGGLEIQALTEASRLRDRRNMVWIACPAGSRLETEAVGRGLTTVPVRVGGYFHPAAIVRLAVFLRRSGVDVVHSQLSKDLATIVPALYLAGLDVPLFLSKRVGSYITKRTPLHRFTYGRVTRVLAISDVIRKNVIDTTPMDPANVLTVHHGVNLDEFSFSAAGRARVREELEVRDDQLLIGFVGRFSPGKGHEEFLEAASELVKRHDHVRFAIVGEASYREEAYEQSIRAMSRKLSLDGVLTFTGFRKDVRDVMAAFDIFAFPSHAEAFGAVLIEAMALERPVVASNCDGVVDIVVDGETGFSMSPGNARELEAGLDRLISNPALRERMGRAGRRRVEDHFNEEILIDRLEGLYDEASRRD
jgi:glycosyltransferase involved in cell wall biosynthesis